MPIHTSVPIEIFDQERFHSVDKIVTGHAFDIHNEFGRYLGEKLYQAELARRCQGAGFHVDSEMRIAVTLDDFIKIYLVDLLVNRGVILETKAVATLTPSHTAQTLNYLLLCGLHHGGLFNFHSERVQREFVSTGLNFEKRRQYKINDHAWSRLRPECDQLRTLLPRLFSEWGTHLDPLLYRDALTHFLGGPERVVRSIPVQSGGLIIGTQEMHLHAEDVGFSVTASLHHPRSVEEHQRRFLNHTSLRAIQWINLHHHNIELRTLQKR
jgi:GxxExxY protein